MSRALIVIACLVVPLACKSRVATPAELHAYIVEERNGLTRSFETGDIKISVSYLPTDYWVSQQLNDQDVGIGVVDSLRSIYASRFYFLVSFARNGREALVASRSDSYSDLVHTMSFRMSDYVSLINEDNEDIPIGDYVLNRTYGLGTSTDVLFVFDDPKVHSSSRFRLDIKEFGLGAGNHQFEFLLDDLTRSPNIDFSL